MRDGAKILGILILFVSIIIFFIKNKDIMKNSFYKIINIKFIFIFILIILGCIFLYKNCVEIV